MSKVERQQTLIFILIVLLLVFAFTVFFRWENLVQRPLLSHNEDAMGHVLFTVAAQMHSDAQSHLYLPLVTSPASADRGIDNFLGASAIGEDGIFFYVSFPPLSFALPTFILSLLDLEPSLLNLRLISLATGFLTAAGILMLLLQILPRNTANENDRLFIALFAALAYLMHPEALWSHGNILWAHILYQPILTFSCLLLALTLRNPCHIRYIAGFCALVVLGCLIDWSAYLFAVGSFLVLLVWFWRTKEIEYLRVAGLLAAAGCFALSAILLHWSQRVPLSSFLETLGGRPASHHFGAAQIIESLRLLALYLGPLAIANALLLIAVLQAKRFRSALNPLSLSILFAFTCATFETFLFLQHSTWYAYGMLKPILLGVLVLSFLAAELVRKGRQRWVPAVILFTFTVFGLSMYAFQNPANLERTDYAKQFEELDKIAAYAAPDEAVFANISWPLGHELGRVGRNIISTPLVDIDINIKEAQQWLSSRGSATKGKLFIFDRQAYKDEGLIVWWARTKTKVRAPATYTVGKLLAIVSFTPQDVIDVELAKSAYIPTINGRATLHPILTNLLPDEIVAGFTNNGG